MPLTDVNRSVVKYGLKKLNSSKRPGIRAIFESSKIENIGTYEINYVIAPRINAMGRLAQGIDSLRLLCTTKLDRAKELSRKATAIRKMLAEASIDITENKAIEICAGKKKIH